MEIKACYNCGGTFGHAIKEGLCSECYREVKAQEALEIKAELGDEEDGDE